jgi:Na+-translocating ferredoxin:NAD+ oxidoreductase RnfC subunit
MKEPRRVPLAQLRRRLRIEAYEGETPFASLEHRSEKVRILLSQHTGVPAKPAVSRGDMVEAGEVVGRVPERELGANVHASIAGRVARVTEQFIEIGA